MRFITKDRDSSEIDGSFEAETLEEFINTLLSEPYRGVRFTVINKSLYEDYDFGGKEPNNDEILLYFESDYD